MLPYLRGRPAPTALVAVIRGWRRPHQMVAHRAGYGRLTAEPVPAPEAAGGEREGGEQGVGGLGAVRVGVGGGAVRGHEHSFPGRVSDYRLPTGARRKRAFAVR